MKSRYSNNGTLNFRNSDPFEIIHFNTFFKKIWPVFVDLSNCNLSNEHTATIMNFIKDNNRLTELILNSNFLGEEFFGNLCTELF
jgi:hypothetical protein